MRWITLSDRSLDHFLYSLIRLCHQLSISPIPSVVAELTSTEFFLASALLELAHLAAEPSKMILVAYLISLDIYEGHTLSASSYAKSLISS